MSFQKIGEMVRVYCKRQFLPLLPPSVGTPDDSFYIKLQFALFSKNIYELFMTIYSYVHIKFFNFYISIQILNKKVINLSYYSCVPSSLSTSIFRVSPCFNRKKSLNLIFAICRHSLRSLGGSLIFYNKQTA